MLNMYIQFFSALQFLIPFNTKVVLLLDTTSSGSLGLATPVYFASYSYANPKAGPHLSILAFPFYTRSWLLGTALGKSLSRTLLLLDISLSLR